MLDLGLTWVYTYSVYLGNAAEYVGQAVQTFFFSMIGYIT